MTNDSVYFGAAPDPYDKIIAARTPPLAEEDCRRLCKRLSALGDAPSLLGDLAEFPLASESPVWACLWYTDLPAMVGWGQVEQPLIVPQIITTGFRAESLLHLSSIAERESLEWSAFIFGGAKGSGIGEDRLRSGFSVSLKDASVRLMLHVPIHSAVKDLINVIHRFGISRMVRVDGTQEQFSVVSSSPECHVKIKGTFAGEFSIDGFCAAKAPMKGVNTVKISIPRAAMTVDLCQTLIQIVEDYLDPLASDISIRFRNVEHYDRMRPELSSLCSAWILFGMSCYAKGFDPVQRPQIIGNDIRLPILVEYGLPQFTVAPQLQIDIVHSVADTFIEIQSFEGKEWMRKVGDRLDTPLEFWDGPFHRRWRGQPQSPRRLH